MTGSGDPRDEDAVGVVDEVVPRERVHEVALAGEVGGGDRHELTVASCRRYPPGPHHEVIAVGGEKGRGHEGGRVVAGPRGIDDLGDGGGVTDHESVDQLRAGGGHGGIVEGSADTALTRGLTREPTP